jgi:two-component system, NtrC family, response regulator AtoC
LDPDSENDGTTLEQRVADAPEHAPVARRMAVVLYHREGVSAFELHEGATKTVGRSAPSDVRVADPSLSRMHAEFSLHEGVLTVADLDSTNGTQIAGAAVRRAALRPGQEVRLGAVRGAAHHITSDQAPEHGIDGYEQFVQRLQDETLRAHAFGRPFALVMLRASAEPERHFSTWLAAARSALRPVDRVGVYDAASLLLLLPELDAERASAVAVRAVEAAGDGPALVSAVASFPQAASSAEKLLGCVRQACPRGHTAAPVLVPERASERRPAEDVVVRSPRMQALYQMIGQIAPKGISVLLTGETGTGKEVFAAALHRQSGRKGPLRAVNCATIPATLTESVLFGHERGAFSGAVQRAKGVFEDADGGTLLLDEVGELSAQAQAALLRVLQTRRVTRVGSNQEIEVDVRVVAATHRDLEQMVEQGEFREDLLYRINAITLRLPPLRERPEEIEPLAEAFLRDAAAQWGSSAHAFSPAALEALRGHHWPGNVRELRNVIERAAALSSGPLIEPDDLGDRLRREPSGPSRPGPQPEPSTQSDPFRDRVRNFEAELIAEALRRCGGNVSKAADMLQIPVRTLGYRMKALGIKSSNPDA